MLYLKQQISQHLMQQGASTSLISWTGIASAQSVIKGRLHRTPIMTSEQIGRDLDCKLWLKMELFQKTGSFKPRGVLNKIHHLSAKERNKGVISLSAGNHAQAVAWGAATIGVPTTIFMPAGSYASKIQATRAYGAEVILTEGDLLAECLTMQEEKDLTLLHPFNDLHVIAGQATVGAEIWEEIPDLDLVVMAVGGGGLISGAAAALKLKNPNIRIVGVEPSGAAVISKSLAAGHPVSLDKIDTIADGLAAPFTGHHNLNHIRAFVDEMVIVEDREIIDSLVYLMERTKVYAEPSAAAPLAALRTGKISYDKGEKIGCIICGGNMDRNVLKSIL